MTLREYFIACNRGPWETHGELDNFDVFIVPYRGARWLAHRGFVRKYKSIADDLMARLKDAEAVYFVGYS